MDDISKTSYYLQNRQERSTFNTYSKQSKHFFKRFKGGRLVLSATLEPFSLRHYEFLWLKSAYNTGKQSTGLMAFMLCVRATLKTINILQWTKHLLEGWNLKSSRCILPYSDSPWYIIDRTVHVQLVLLGQKSSINEKKLRLVLHLCLFGYKVNLSTISIAVWIKIFIYSGSPWLRLRCAGSLLLTGQEFCLKTQERDKKSLTQWDLNAG